jgi:hypothetical protein
MVAHTHNTTEKALQPVLQRLLRAIYSNLDKIFIIVA